MSDLSVESITKMLIAARFDISKLNEPSMRVMKPVKNVLNRLAPREDYFVAPGCFGIGAGGGHLYEVAYHNPEHFAEIQVVDPESVESWATAMLELIVYLRIVGAPVTPRDYDNPYKKRVDSRHETNNFFQQADYASCDVWSER